MFGTIVEIGGRSLDIDIHDFGHLDEVATIWLIDHFATVDWLEKFCPDGRLALGLGGGWADDHSKSLSEAERRKTSCFGLVAKSLGVYEHPEITHIRRYVEYEDNHRSKASDTLARVLWIMHHVWPEDEEDNMNWALLGVHYKWNDHSSDFRIGHIAKLMPDDVDREGWLRRGRFALARYQEMFDQAVTEFKAKQVAGQVLVRRVTIKGQEWPLVGIESDNVRMSAVIRSSHGLSAGVIVLRNSRGHHYISVNDAARVNLDEAVSILRYREQKQKGELRIRDWQRLKEEGEIAQIPEWFYFKQARMIFNGSITKPDVTPSRLDLKEVFFSVLVGLSSELFFPKFKEECQSDHCQGRVCPWYAFGLARCRGVRYRSSLVKVA
jgi:hypothetical protein